MKLEFLPDGSPDCPLIRLYEFDQTEAKRLVEIVNRLASSSQQAIALHEEVWIESIGSCKLDLCVARKNSGVVQAAQLIFECLLTGDRWSDMADLLEPFRDADTAGFQWLNEDGAISLLLSTDGSW